VRILWLKTELLHPVDKGGRIRTYHMLKELKHEHHITYLTLDDGLSDADARERAIEYCHELICVPHHTRAKFTPGFYWDLTRNLGSRLPYFIMKYESPSMRREIEQRAAHGTIDVVVCDFLMSSVNMPAQVPCATVLFQHNVEAMIWKRHYEVQENPLKKLYLYGQWRKAFSFERHMCRRFDQVVAVSPEDRKTMERDYSIDSVSHVPTGVDTNYFRPSTAKRNGPPNIVFTGSMDWLPNDDAMKCFIRDVLPLIKRSIPDIKLTVVGRKPYSQLLEMSKRDPSIVVTGRVDDVRPYIDQASVYVVPIRIGGGTRLKIYEAMAMEKPVVSTTVGAEGLPVMDGREILLADTPEHFAEAVVNVLTDEKLASGLVNRAAHLVREQFGWDIAAEKFKELCGQALEAKALRSEEKIRTDQEVEAVI